jgi:site-specific DNA recombinase
VKDAVERNAMAGKRSGGGSRPFGYKIVRHDLGEGGKRRWRIVGEDLEPAEEELIKESATRVLRGESLRSIAMDWNERGLKTVGGGKWQGSMIRRVLMSPRIAGIREHRGEIVGEATWPAIIDRATHDRLVGLLGTRAADPRTTAGRASTLWLAWSTAGPAAGLWSRTSSPGRAVATAAARTRTSSARGASASPPSRWRSTSRGT